MPTLTYVVLSRDGPNEGLENANASATQTLRRYWRFMVSCSFHGQHSAVVLDPYTPAQVRAAIELACRTAYQTDPSVGQSWQQTF